MDYNCAKLIGGGFTQGIRQDWNWLKNGGGYDQNRDFFSIHYEVQERDPTSVRLHVEAPRYAVDQFLNDLKQKVLDAFLVSNIPAVTEQNGYIYKRGPRVSQTGVRSNKCTEAFRVVLNDAQRKPMATQNIEEVAKAIGQDIDLIIKSFAKQLDQHFST